MNRERPERTTPGATETTHVFGEGHRRVGILTLPAGGARGPLVVCSNAGLIHRIGPRRLHVRMARRLADAGFPCFRMDHSGIGDSEPRRDGLGAVEGLLQDVREALDHLEEAVGATRRFGFVLFGICSGAKVAYQSALQESRVRGLVLVDPGDFGYGASASPAAGGSEYVQHYTKHYWRKVFSRGLSFARVRRWLTGKANYAFARKVIGSQLRNLRGGRAATRALRDRLVADLGGLTDREVEVLLLHAEQGPSLVFHESMLQETERSGRFRDRLRSEVLPRTNHTFPTIDSQEDLLQRVQRWAVSRFSTTSALPTERRTHGEPFGDGLTAAVAVRDSGDS